MSRKFFDIHDDRGLIEWHTKEKAVAVRMLMEDESSSEERSLDIWTMNRDKGTPDVKLVTITGRAHIVAAALSSMDLESL